MRLSYQISQEENSEICQKIDERSALKRLIFITYR